MLDQNTDFFKIADNFAKTADIPSIPIIKATLGFIPKVTIAIPTYKRPELLKEALDSAINQEGYTEYEIIVVDNDPELGCETEQLMSKYKNLNVSYYKNSVNLGMVGNWNRCISLSNGEYISILHDDDAISSSFILNSINTIQKGKKFFSFGVIACPEIPSTFNEIIKKNIQFRPFRTRYFLFGNLSSFPGIIFPKEYAKLIGGFNESKYPIADYDFWIRLSEEIKCYRSNTVLAFYRISESQATNSCQVNLIAHTWERRQKIRYYWFFESMSNYELYKMLMNYVPSPENMYELEFSYPKLYEKMKRYEKIVSYPMCKIVLDIMLKITVKFV